MTLILALLVASAAAEPCAEPASFPQTSTVHRRFWGTLATLDFSPMTFHQTPGYCRKGPSWAHKPALDTNVGHTKGASNNAFGDKLWFCFEEPRTLLGCMAECEARPDCGSLDRPNVPESEECCLFWPGNTGDDAPNRNCWVRKELSELPPGSLLHTSVTVMPLPIITYLKLTSQTHGVTASAERWLCPTWTWCSFTIKDCFGDVLYEVSVEWTTDLDGEGNQLLGTEVIAYFVKSRTGALIGRTSRLTDGGEPVRLFNANNEQVAMMVTAGGWMWRTFFPLKWFVNVVDPGAPVDQEPMQDPRLLSFIVTFQYRNLGYFATCLLLLLILAALFVAFYMLKVYRGQGRCYACLPFWLRECLENNCGCCVGWFSSFSSRQQFVVYDEYESTSCCGGRGKNQWKTSIQPLKPAE